MRIHPDQRRPDCAAVALPITAALDLPDGDAYLSPDGGRIATYDGETLCVYTADGQQERCADNPPALDPNSVQWNAAGDRLLFTEDFFVRFLEPDIWSLDAESGDLINLTDDGVDDANILQADTGASVDTSPHWVDEDNPLQMIVAANEHVPQTRQARVLAGQTVVQNFALREIC